MKEKLNCHDNNFSKYRHSTEMEFVRLFCSENSQVAVDIFNRESLMSVLWPWLEKERFGLAFSTVVGKTMYNIFSIFHWGLCSADYICHQC